MPHLPRATPILVLMLSMFAQTAQAQPKPDGLEATYLESPASTASTLARNLQAYAIDTRKQPGAVSIQVLRELGRPNRMLVLENWFAQHEASVIRHEAALEARAGELQAPVDRRRNGPLVAQLPAAAPPQALHVVAHLDVMPEAAPIAAGALREMGAAILAAPGGLGFEAGLQADHPNHFTIYEVWATRQAYEAWAATEAGQALRRKLAPYKGSPYDDRYYEELP